MTIEIKHSPFGDVTYKVSQHFGLNPLVYSQFGYAGHNGLDLVPYDENGRPFEAPLFVVNEGKVVEVGIDPDGYGGYCKVLHERGCESLTGHMLNDLSVGINYILEAGEMIGFCNDTGFSSGLHAHIEFRDPTKKRVGYRRGQYDPYPSLIAFEKSQGEIIPDPISALPFQCEVKRGSLALRRGPGREYELVRWMNEGERFVAKDIAIISKDEIWLSPGEDTWCAAVHTGFPLLVKRV